MILSDTIVAISSASGAGWRGIVRLSGPGAHGLALQAVEPIANAGGTARCTQTVLRRFQLPAMLLRFNAPHSFTGQDCAELHVPGSAPLLRGLMNELVANGARPAEAGEFSARAFFNGKMDLTQAEGIAATIGATSQRQLRAAASLREGALLRWVRDFSDQLALVLALVEAGIDFSDEPGVTFISDAEVGEKLRAMLGKLTDLRAKAVRWERLETEPAVVFFGCPNVGKSSLINVLCGEERAIVSPVAGTTRDMLSAVLHTANGAIRLLDVAGVEESAGVWHAGMNQARNQALLEADVVALVFENKETFQAGMEMLRIAYEHNGEGPLLAGRLLLVRNKVDLADKNTAAEAWQDWAENELGRHHEMAGKWVRVSAKTGEGVPVLRRQIERMAGRQETAAGERITLNRRHLRALGLTHDALARALHLVETAGGGGLSAELLASELRLALNAVGEISGAVSPDEILGRIFSTFCIGK